MEKEEIIFSANSVKKVYRDEEDRIIIEVDGDEAVVIENAEQPSFWSEIFVHDRYPEPW